mmetsp:Transcript_3596/g.5214  ORF Transcript_3596/g.5214 Transcript_3596/m.5214 type:complete len:819 (-) Transcript_3596:192-2648(-)
MRKWSLAPGRKGKVYSQSFINEKAGNIVRSLSSSEHQKRESKKVSLFKRNSSRREAFKSELYLDHSDIKKHAIQIFHTDLAETQGQMERRKETKWFVLEKPLNPNGRFRRYFDLITVVWVMMLVFSIPFEIGFNWYITSDRYNNFSTILDIWFAIDIILNFRTGYIFHGTVVMDPDKIVRHYLGTWFAVDLLGTFPFERIISPSEAKSRKSFKLVKYFKIPKLMRLSRLLKYLHDHRQVYDLFEVLVFVVIFLHFGACIWVRVIDPCPEDYLAIDEDDICAQSQISTVYAEILHFSAVMILGISNLHIVADTDTLTLLNRRLCKEKTVGIYFVSTLFMVGGLFIIALLISKMNVYVTGRMQGSAVFQQRNDRVRHEMEYYAVPDELQAQVKAFYNYVWIHQRQYDDKIALLSDDQMSTDLQRKLALHLYKDVVSHISFFSEIDDLLLGEICLSLRTRIFLPKDMILFKGDMGKELFIIAKGVVEVLRDDLPPSKRFQHPPILLRKGSFFGEIALIMETQRTCSVQSKTICEVNVLEQETFDSILRAHPDFARKMNELVVSRQLETCLSRTKSRGFDFKVTKSDMELAVNMVEQNMHAGLQRRMNEHAPQRTLDTRTRERNAIVEKVIARNSDVVTANGSTSSMQAIKVFDDIAQRSKCYSDTHFVGDHQRENSQYRMHSSSHRMENRSQNSMTSAAPNSTCVEEIEPNAAHGPLHMREEEIDVEEGEVDENAAEGHYIPGQEVEIGRILPSIVNAPEAGSQKSLQEDLIRTLLPADLIDNEDLLNCLSDNPASDCDRASSGNGKAADDPKYEEAAKAG